MVGFFFNQRSSIISNSESSDSSARNQTPYFKSETQNSSSESELFQPLDIKLREIEETSESESPAQSRCLQNTTKLYESKRSKSARIVRGKSYMNNDWDDNFVKSLSVRRSAGKHFAEAH